MLRPTSERVQLDLKATDVASIVFLTVAVQAFFMDRLDVAMNAVRTLTDGLPLMAEAAFIALAMLLVTGALKAVMIVLKIAIDILEAVQDKEPRDPHHGAQP